MSVFVKTLRWHMVFLRLSSDCGSWDSTRWDPLHPWPLALTSLPGWELLAAGIVTFQQPSKDGSPLGVYWSKFSSENLLRHHTNRTKGIYYEGLSHVIMEAKKSHSLPSASWNPGGSVILVLTWRPENQGFQWCKPQAQRLSKGPRTRNTSVWVQEKTDVLAQAENRFDISLLFCSIQALDGLDVAHLHWRESPSLLSLLIRS